MLTDLVELANGGGGKSKGNGGGGAFSFLWGTEKSGFMHLELYTFMPAAASKGPLLPWLSMCDGYAQTTTTTTTNLTTYTHTHGTPKPHTHTDSRPSPQEPQAQLVRTVSAGEWVVESVAGVDEARNLVFVTGTWRDVGTFL